MIAEAVSGFFQGVVKPILDKVVPDAKDRLEAEQVIMKGMLSLDLGQMDVNKEEAKSSSLFVAGWRPAIGWICASTYAYNFVLQPFMVFILAVAGVTVPPLPSLDASELSMVLMGMLGLGTMRSIDKYHGTSK